MGLRVKMVENNHYEADTQYTHMKHMDDTADGQNPALPIMRNIP